MEKSSLKEITLLYVEDEAIIRDELAEILEEEVAKLYIAKNGEEALRLFAEHDIDLIFTDIRMPVMDGLKMSQTILHDNPNMPIIISSAFNDTEYLMQSIQLGIQYYLLKPINLKEVFATLEKAALNIVNAKQLRKDKKLLQEYKDVVDKNSIVSKADRNGIITYVNPAFCRISGYSEDELIGSSHNIVRHPDTSKDLFKDMWNTILSNKPWHGKIKNRAKDGSDYIVDSTILPVLGPADEIQEFISIRRDITQEERDKEQLEKRLQTSAQTLEEKIQFIYEYENALKKNTLFCRTTAEGKLTMASDAFIELFGINAAAIKGISYFDLVHTDYTQTLNTEVRDAIRQHEGWQGLIIHKNKEGDELYLESSFFPIMDTQGNVHEVLCFYIDTTEQFHLNKEIIATQREVIATMGAIGETRSKETGDHVKRVAEYSKLLALKHGLSLEEAEQIKMASPMHDIGKVGIADLILNKPGKLSEEEFEIMKTHAKLGHDMLKGSQQSLLKTAAIISHEHHEKWDGSGYPRGLKGEEIHLYGRITAIADVFDALGHDRVYKKAWPLQEILDLFKEGRGKHFDPNLIDLFFDNLDDFLAIKESFDGINKESYELI